MTTSTKAKSTKQNKYRSSTGPKMPQAKPEEMVADKIIELLEKGELPPWSRPWKYSRLGAAHNAVSKKPYRGINIWLLALATAMCGYDDPRWLTYKQAQQLGGNVQKGEKSTWIVFWKIVSRRPNQDVDADGVETTDQEEDPKGLLSFPMARIYNVFNATQTEGCKLPPLSVTDAQVHNPIEQAENIIALMPYPPEFQTFLHENSPPHYIPSLDKVRVPDISRYDQPELYYNSIFHELVHSTGHEKRLNRFTSTTMGAQDLHQYGTEELVAGMGAAMLTAKAGLEQATLQADASYIKHWADRIKADKSIIMTSAQRAQRAVDYISPPLPGHEQETEQQTEPADAGVPLHT